MNTSSERFIDRLRKNKIKSPTQQGFSIGQWEKEWNKSSVHDERDNSIYEAGKVFNSILSEIRESLMALYSRSPSISDEELVSIYFSLSNRDREILSRQSKDLKKSTGDYFSQTLRNNEFNIELTFDEIANGAVDGLAKAIYYCVKRIADGNITKDSKDPLDEINYILRESNYSQLYDTYESLWRALVYSDYRFIEISKKDKRYCICQQKTELEVGAMISDIRKSRLEAQRGSLAVSDTNLNMLDQDKCIRIKKEGKKIIIKSAKLSSMDDMTRYINASWRSQEQALADILPEDILNNDFDNGFCIIEALNVFRCLILLSHLFSERYPSDDGFENIKKLQSFCPKIKKVKLLKALTNVTDFSVKKLSAILKFIAFDSEGNKDLWSHPILEISKDRYILLTSSLATPSIIRVTEHWLNTLNIDLQSKGSNYEELVLDNVNRAVSSNAYIKDVNKAVSKRIRLDSSEEEIDFLMRIGKIILVGEAKSIVTTDSPISQYRTLQTLKGASVQVRRKSKFVNDNMESVFNSLGWSYEKSKNYEIVECIINSGRMFVGFSIDNVPICDEITLEKYFSSKIIPYFSTIIGKDRKQVHLAWFNLYSSIEELQNNIKLYLEESPQINTIADDFDYKENNIPTLNKNSYKITYRRLVSNDLSTEERLSRKYKFPLETVDDIHEQLSQMDYSF